MGAPFHSVDRKCEDAFGGLIEQLTGVHLAGYTIYKGKSGKELVGNRVEVFCPRATGEMAGDSDVFTGNWRCDVEITLVTNYADKTRDQREDAAAELFDAILDHDNLAEQLNNVEGVKDFHAYGGLEGAGEGLDGPEMENTDEGHEYRKTLGFSQYCRPS